MWQLWFKTIPFAGKTPVVIAMMIAKNVRPPMSGDQEGKTAPIPSPPAALATLIGQCWSSDASKRPTIEVVFTSFDDAVVPAISAMADDIVGPELDRNAVASLPVAPSKASGQAPESKAEYDAALTDDIISEDTLNVVGLSMRSLHVGLGSLMESAKSNLRGPRTLEIMKERTLIEFLDDAGIGKYAQSLNELGYGDVLKLMEADLTNELLESVVGMSKLEIRKLKESIKTFKVQKIGNKKGLQSKLTTFRTPMNIQEDMSEGIADFSDVRTMMGFGKIGSMI